MATLSSIWPPIFTLEDVQLQLLLLGWQEKDPGQKDIYSWRKDDHLIILHLDPGPEQQAISYFHNWFGTTFPKKITPDFDNYFQLMRHITHDSGSVADNPG